MRLRLCLALMVAQGHLAKMQSFRFPAKFALEVMINKSCHCKRGRICAWINQPGTQHDETGGPKGSKRHLWNVCCFRIWTKWHILGQNLLFVDGILRTQAHQYKLSNIRFGAVLDFDRHICAKLAQHFTDTHKILYGKCTIVQQM